jgi:FkbM family methyltransferase
VIKAYSRKLAQKLGVYEALGIGIAHFRGISRRIRILRTDDLNFQIVDDRGRSIFVNRRHAIYLSDVVSYFDFYHSAVVADKNNEVHYEKPAWHSLPGDGAPFYFTSFAESPSTLELYSQLAEIKPGDVIFDVGACCGLSSREFDRIVSDSGHVYAFEADPENFSALEKNRAKSDMRNVTIEHLAVWKESGELQFQSDGTAGAGVAAVAARHNSTVTVPSITLADYIARKKIDRIDLLKIDVEGSEVEILSSSISILRQFRPALIVELHPVHDVWTTNACRTLLEAENYQTRIVPQPGTTFPLLVAKPVTRT